MRGSMRLLAFLAVALAASVAVTPPAQAGFEVHGPVVADGRSPHGVHWHIRGQHDRRHALDFDFSLDPPGYADAGYVVQLQFPIPDEFLFTATAGSDLDPYNESDLSGITRRRVATLVVKMSMGDPLRVHPRRAPPGVRERHPWVRGLRFFDRFFAAGREPRRVTALDANGSALASSRSHGGTFNARDR